MEAGKAFPPFCALRTSPPHAARLMLQRWIARFRRIVPPCRSPVTPSPAPPSSPISGGCNPIGTPAPTHGAATAPRSVDERKVLRRSHENPVVQQLYDEFLERPNSHKVRAPGECAREDVHAGCG